MNIRSFCVIVIICALFTVPALAGVKYMTGGPSLNTAISGANELVPGTDAKVLVRLENRGLIDMEFVQSGYMKRDDMPNTAKFITAALSSGDSPLVIKTDPQFLGDLAGGQSTTVAYTVKVPNDAHGGTYTLPITLTYQYMQEAEQIGQDSLQYRYKDKKETLPLTVKIKDTATVTVSAISTEHLNVGNEGFVTVSVKNTGSEPAALAVLRILQNGNSPVVPTDSSVFIGALPVNQTAEARFKVSVSRDAQEAEYPVDLVLTYQNREGDTVNSEKVTVGIPVRGKITFDVVSAPAWLSPGAKGVITVEYQNSGAATAYNSQARISAVDPFTSNDDTAFLGDIAPGQTGIARFEMTVDKAATTKEYGLDSEVRYLDALNNSQISDTIKVRVEVSPPGGIAAVTGNPLFWVVIALIVLGAGFYWYRKRNNTS